jgi:hypothetical protein
VIVLSLKLFWGQNFVSYNLVCDLVKSNTENTIQHSNKQFVAVLLCDV